jgi:hypothetical protein
MFEREPMAQLPNDEQDVGMAGTQAMRAHRTTYKYTCPEGKFTVEGVAISCKVEVL